MILINFTANKHWIDGILEDFGDGIDHALGLMDNNLKTTIKDIILEPNGNDSAFFSIEGKDFSCGFDVGHGGICKGESDWLTFSGYGGHVFRIKSPK